jgi:hypothetical protein
MSTMLTKNTKEVPYFIMVIVVIANFVIIVTWPWRSDQYL